MKTVLFVEDEQKLRTLMMQMVERSGNAAAGAGSGAEALQLLEARDVDVVVLDMMLPDTTGLELLSKFKSDAPELPVIILTAYGNVETAVAAMKAGAFDYITKPANFNELRVVIDRALQWRALRLENQVLKQDLTAVDEPGLVAASAGMQRVLEMVRRVAHTEATVLLQGESGTGKTMVARIVHRLSPRRDRPFIAVNCAAIPENLLESELFGYRKGAFTGATENRIGKFEAADGGTIFLDEIGETSPALQAKLLQVTQEKTFMRLGSTASKSVDVRIVAATNRDLRQLVKEGRFREDLYYRLNIVGMTLPPLRDRSDDVPALVGAVLNRLATRGRRRPAITDEALLALRNYHWPGNVRELENVLERAALLCTDHVIDLQDLPPELLEHPPASGPAPAPGGRSLPTQVDQLENAMISAALAEHNNNHSRAANALGISRQTLLYKMRRLGIQHTSE